MADKKTIILISVLAGCSTAIMGGFFLPAAQVILGLGAVALVGAVLLFWSSIRTLGGETELLEQLPEKQADGDLDEKVQRKKMLLLALKDLDNERKLGKITEDDYGDVARRYRDEIKTLMREIDAAADPYRNQAEKVADAFLAGRGGGDKKEKADAVADASAYARAAARRDDASAKSDDANATDAKAAVTLPEEPAIPTKKSREGDSSKREVGRTVCAKCGESNEPDAKFCKGCAAPMKTESPEKTGQSESPDA